METYLPAPFNFFNWADIEKSFLKKKPLNYPKCIELNITKRNDFESRWENELDIFTIKRILKEIKDSKVEWIVLGKNYDVFFHKKISEIFKILKDLNLNVYSLKTEGLYLNRVELDLLFKIVKENLFIKKKKPIKKFEEEIFKENLNNLISFKIKNNISKPKVLLFEEDFNKDERKEMEKEGILFLKDFYFCLKEVVPFLPYFFLSIGNNGFCYIEDEKNPISTIFFNSIKKIWNSKELKKLRRDIEKVYFFTEKEKIA